jgi:hypothetical protein
MTRHRQIHSTTIRNIVRQANALGLTVRFDPIQAA